MVLCVSHVHNVEAAWVLFEVRNCAYSPDVVSSCDHDCIPSLELVDFVDFLRFQVEFNGVIRMDIRVWEPDCPAVVRHKVGNLDVSFLQNIGVTLFGPTAFLFTRHSLNVASFSSIRWH